ncbi:hypothetical protein [Caulobacter sp. S45]|uniref:hypothetical protein n=1 Tax=Caulobacter sp. S45 TaxID=1641861 RepID=UPI00131E1B6D|nr:hypothetical protein [Caulobacter sp. S45]
MTVDSVIFDARSDQSSLVEPGGVVMLAIVAVFLVVAIRSPRFFRRGDSTLNRAIAIVALVAVGAIMLTASLSFWTSLKSKEILSRNGGVVIQGCVRDFRRDVHQGEHNIADTYFSIGDQSFHFNASPWISGFHNEDDAIRPDDRLRITMKGASILRIERAPNACPRPLRP